MKKRAFTLSEAILTMVVLGVIATTMITTMKPTKYRDQGYLIKKQKIYAELDQITDTIVTQYTKDMKLSNIYNSYVIGSSSTHTFGASNGANEKPFFSNYMRTSGSCDCKPQGATSHNAKYNCLNLRTGTCICIGAMGTNSIWVDVDGVSKGPNADGQDQMWINTNDEGISSAMPESTN